MSSTNRLDIKEIATRVRADIKAAIKAGKLPALKVAVRISRYANGQSLTAEITDAPAGFPVTGTGRAKCSPEMVAVIATIEAIVAAYNRDHGSDPMTDYYNVDFYAHVQVSGDLRKRG